MKVTKIGKMCFSGVLAILMIVCMLIVCIPTVKLSAETQEDLGSGLKVGASIKDITPTDDMLPIHAGNARMGLRLVGVVEGLAVRVIALQNDNASISLFVSTETGKFPYPPDFVQWLSDATGVSTDNIFTSATHVHSAPEITDASWQTMEDSYNTTTGKNEGRYENLRKWGYMVRDQMIAAAQEAIENMVEAEVGIGYTNSYINVNRVTKYVDATTGDVTYAEGFNGDGPSDKTLAVIEFRTRETQESIAFIVNYAMHLTALYGNQYYLPEYASVNGFTEDDIYRDDTLLDSADIENNSVGIHPDIGGLVSRYMESAYEGSVAIWSSGAAGNQNPIFRNNMISADTTTGLKTEFTKPGADIMAVEYYAGIQFVDVKTALASITEYESDTPITFAWGGTELENKTEGANPINVYLTVMRIGDITFAGSPSELYNGIAVDMKEGSVSEHTVVFNHCWTHAEETTGYFPDDWTLENGSDRSVSYVTGTINSSLTALMNELIAEAEPVWTYAGDGTATNIDTGEVTIVGLDGIAGTDDDNRVVNPAGTTLMQDVELSRDEEGNPYVSLGNGFMLYGGEDGIIGTGDDEITDFGSYPQSDASGESKDPISWRLLDIQDDGATAVLIASQCLDAAYFNLEDNKDKNDWETSNLRSWLNSRGGKAVRNTFSTEDDPGFYDVAFSTAEKEKINLTTVKMDYSDYTKWDPAIFVRPEGYATYNETEGNYPAYDTVWFAQINASNPNDWTGNGNNPSNMNSPWVLTSTTGVDTEDYVYAISGEEYFEYFGEAWVEGDGWDLVNYRNGYFSASEYASARGAKTSPTSNLPFAIVDSMARSPGRSDLQANGTAYGVFWSGTGSMNVGRPVYGNPTEANIATVSTYGIIPMINVDLSGNTEEDGTSYSIEASVNGEGGSITPSGSVSVAEGESQTFNIAANAGFEVDRVLVDGTEVTLAGNTYAFTNVTANHTIIVTFKATVTSVETYTVKATANQGGNVTANAEVEAGGIAEITVEPNSGYKLVAFLVDGVTVDISEISDDTYTIENVQSDMTVIALFVKDQDEDFAAKFTDVPNGDWYYAAVDMLTGLDIVEGKTSTTYEPTTNVTRAEFTKLLFELASTLGVDVAEVDSIPFTDMPVNDYWAEGYIGWAYENGIVKGYTSTTFGPDDSISRQDMALMLQRFFEEYMGYDLPGDKTISFTDKAAIADYAEDSVNYVVRTGLMQGFDVGTFGPEESTLRSQVVQILFNYLIF